jgi:putative polyketide hydroxylase
MHAVEAQQSLPVLIVGGGPVGLAASLELARFGVASILLEQHATVAFHPKTRNFNTRTMEIARLWGRDVYGRLRDIDTPPGWKSPIRFFDFVTGHEFGAIETTGFAGPGPDISPAQPIMSSQDLVEKILLDAAAATGLVELRFGHQVTRIVSGWEAEDSCVAIEVTDSGSGQTYALTGAALVGADGAASMVRAQLGVELTGQQALNHFVNCYFYADIEQYVADRPGVLFFVANPGAAGVLQPLDARGRWLCQIAVPAERWTDAFDEDDCRRFVRAAVGVPDLTVDVRSIGRWQMNATVADRFVRGRVVLCGDAAHQFPPTGGLGVNTGLQGMHNAMWKLAFCLKGQARWSLLETYDDERRAPAERTATQSLHNHQQVQQLAVAQYTGADPGLDVNTILQATRRYGNHLGVEFGSVYTSSAIISDGMSAPVVADDYSDYQPSGTPGCRAPHIWLGRSASVSTLDLIGNGFTVLTGRDGIAWKTAASVVAGRFEVAVGCYVVGDPGLEDEHNAFVEVYGITSAGAVLIRPDGYIAWRSAGSAADPVAALVDAIARLLGS